MGCKATRGDVLRPDQFSGFGGHRVKMAYELAIVLFKVHYNLGYGQSSTWLVGYSAVVVVILTMGAGVCLQGLPWCMQGG